MRVSGSLKELAKLGDAILNFAASAALTLREGQPHGVKVPDRVLRTVSKQVGIQAIGSLEPDDVLEAVIAYAWLRGFSAEDMARITLDGMREGGIEDGLVALMHSLLPYVKELLQLAGR